MHRVRAAILHNLRHRSTARFHELQRPTGLESDSFKFHIHRLVKDGLIVKVDDGSYTLTTAGKERANLLDDALPIVRKQTKLSMQLVISRLGSDGQKQYVFQERLRQPYMHYYGLLSGPVPWGEAAETAARRECLKQTGLQADFSVRTVCRARDYARQTGQLLEDKLFLVLQADTFTGELCNTWPHGHNTWLSLEQLQGKAKFYASTEAVLAAIVSGRSYLSLDTEYEQAAY